MPSHTSKNIRRKSSRVAVWKQVALLCLFAGSSAWTDGSLTSIEAEEDANRDFLALSDVANATHNFRIRRSELTCANGDCGGGDVLKVVSQLAKRLLSDPRILRRNSGRSGRASRINSRPFTSSSYYKAKPSAADRQRIADLFTAVSDSAATGSFRKDRYIDYDSTDNDFVHPTNSLSSGKNSEYFDYDHTNDINSLSKNNDISRDTYSEGYHQQEHDSYHSTDDGYGGDSYSGGDSYGGGDSYSGGDSYGGGGYGGGGYGGYGGQCCEDKYLPILLVGSLGLLAFYLYLRSTTTTAAGGGGRRRRSADDEDVSDGTKRSIDIGKASLSLSVRRGGRHIGVNSYLYCCSGLGWSHLVESGARAVGAGRSTGGPQLRPGDPLPDEPDGYGGTWTSWMGRFTLQVHSSAAH